MAGSLTGGNGEPEFQVAPMVDVLLVLLVFFMMITSAQVLKLDKSIKLPLANNAQQKDGKNQDAVVNIRWDPVGGRAVFVYDDQVVVRASDLVPKIKAARDENEKTPAAKARTQPFRLIIRGDRSADASAIAEAMNAGGEAGISDIAFSTVNKD